MGQKNKRQTSEGYIMEVSATANGALSLPSKKCTNASQNYKVKAKAIISWPPSSMGRVFSLGLLTSSPFWSPLCQVGSCDVREGPEAGIKTDRHIVGLKWDAAR